MYSSYANHVASLFDIHASPPTLESEGQPPIEILDAGTGHGSVTLHLARAIQAANPPLPDSNFELASSYRAGSQTEEDAHTSSPKDSSMAAWNAWRASRRAIVHSVEISPIYSYHAHKVISGFRRGLYLPYMDFHVSNVHDWITAQLRGRGNKPFLSYVFLDMPSSDQQLRKVISAMKPEALIAVFVPSVTQVGDCIREIKTHDLPLRWETCVEMGDGISNGRLWDVRLARKKAKSPTSPTVEMSKEKSSDDELRSDESTADRQGVIPDGEATSSSDSEVNSQTDDDPQVMVCRPKVGEMIVGGGFIGLWRRTSSP